MLEEPEDGNMDGNDRVIPPSPITRSLRSRTAHAGERNTTSDGPLVDPLQQSSVYAFADAAAADRAVTRGDPLYSRGGLPNVRSLEQVIADLEGADDAHAVASGMAAITLAFVSLLQSGDHVVAPAGGYCDTTGVLRDVLGRFGVEVGLVDYDGIGAVEAAMTPRTRIVFAETISNPGMELADLPALARLAHASGALLLVDNTFATPVFCRPLEHGADLVVHSAGKFLNGHSDVTAGVIAGSSGLLATIRQTAYLTGPTLDPFDAWLTLRGIRTLAPRMTWASKSAVAIATFLESHPAVRRVRYPGFPPEGRRQLTRDLLPSGAGSVLAFEPAGGPAVAARVIERLQTIPYVPSIGGTMTIVSFPARVPEATGCGNTIAASYKDALIRLSVGLEDPSELMADLDQALNGATSDGPSPR